MFCVWCTWTVPPWHQRLLKIIYRATKPLFTSTSRDDLGILTSSQLLDLTKKYSFQMIIMWWIRVGKGNGYCTSERVVVNLKRKLSISRRDYKLCQANRTAHSVSVLRGELRSFSVLYLSVPAWQNMPGRTDLKDALSLSPAVLGAGTVSWDVPTGSFHNCNSWFLRLMSCLGLTWHACSR